MRNLCVCVVAQRWVSLSVATLLLGRGDDDDDNWIWEDLCFCVPSKRAHSGRDWSGQFPTQNQFSVSPLCGCSVASSTLAMFSLWLNASLGPYCGQCDTSCRKNISAQGSHSGQNKPYLCSEQEWPFHHRFLLLTSFGLLCFLSNPLKCERCSWVAEQEEERLGVLLGLKTDKKPPSPSHCHSCSVCKNKKVRLLNRQPFHHLRK